MPAARTTYTYDEANQLETCKATGNVTTFAYDADGNLFTKNDQAAGVTTYTWDEENRLDEINAAGTSYTFTYNADGRRMRSSEFLDMVALWDGENLLEHTKSFLVLHLHTYEPGTFGSAVSLQLLPAISNKAGYFHFDGLGSVDRITKDTEVVDAAYIYEAYGSLKVDESSETVNRQKFVGGLGYFHDEATGLYYLRARYYDPVTARFLTRDPLAYVAANETAYTYAAGNPVFEIDPMGLQSVVATPVRPGPRPFPPDQAPNTPRDTISRDEYWERWKRGHPGLTNEQYEWAEEKLNTGCVGLTCINLGKWPMNQDCYASENDAWDAKCNRQCPPGSTARVYSVHFFDDANQYPDAGKLDMSPWMNKPRIEWHRGGTGTNFDYGWLRKKGRLLHANHKHKPPVWNMDVYSSTLAKWKESYPDFNQEA